MPLPWKLSKTVLSGIAALVMATTFLGANVATAAGLGDMPAPLDQIPPSMPGGTNWAGYVAEASTGSPVMSIKARWTVPTLTCSTAKTFSTAWVGIDGYSNSVLEQIGTWHYCVQGIAMYGAFYQMHPTPAEFPHFPVRPGDVVQGEVRYMDGDRFQVSLQNLTTGFSYSTITTQANAPRESASAVIEFPMYDGTLQTLPAFSPVRFQDVTVNANGAVGGIRDFRWPSTMLTLYSPANTRLVVPTTLSLDGRSFTINHF
jgi:hypothetical protein